MHVALIIFALGAAIEICAGDEPARIEVVATLSSEAARELPADGISEEQGQRWMRLAVVDEATGRAGEPIFGSYALRDGKLVFTPRRALVAGRLYRAEISGGAETARAEYRVPQAAPQPPPTVEAIYPSESKLPANLLKFYIHFSRPMREGREVFAKIKLVDSSGRTVPDPWRPTELWTADSRRLTLWIHPGRVKEGVNLREDLGPVLEPGESYTLVIVGQLQEQTGQTLGKDAEKKFTVTAADHTQPTVDRWTLDAPRAGTRDPLVIHFPEPLDRHLLDRCLSIRDAADKPITGVGAVAAGERSWTFMPSQPWSEVAYSVKVDEVLEDLAGNTPARPFEVDLTVAKRAPPKLKLEFQPVK